MHEQDLVAPDGTKIRTWRTTSDGPPVLLCPGLGTVPEAWPALLLPSSGVQVHSWYHRGTFGSARPDDPERISLADHASDAITVLDGAGIERCVVLGWSMGVSVATELARTHPERVSGLLLMAGAAGAPFDSVLRVLGVPPLLCRLIANGGTRALQLAGPLLDALLHRIPVNGLTTAALRQSDFLLPASEPEAMTAALSRFLQHDWRWYFTLALAMAAAPRQDLTGISCPVSVLAGRYDLLADARDQSRAAGPLPQARVRMLETSHFLPLELPDVVVQELSLLLTRVNAVERTLAYTAPASTLTSGSRASG